MSRKKHPSKQDAGAPLGWWIGFGVLFVITLAAYWNSFGVPLVFDDLLTIQRNSTVRFGDFSWSWMPSRNILYSTFTLNYLWSGQNVFSYHVVNFLLHVLNGFLIFALAGRIFRRLDSDLRRSRLYAVFAAAFFLLHPVQTESVTYVSSRSELLSTFFYLIGFLIFVLWPEIRIGFFCSLAVGVAWFFGLGSKETVITLPATIFLYDFLFLAGSQFRPLLSRWRFYLTYVIGATAAMYYLLTIALRGSVGADLPGHLSSWSYFLTQLRVVGRYVRIIFAPVGLNLDYDFNPSTSPFEPGVLVSFIFLCGLVLLAWKLRRAAPIFAFSILWFFITLSPTSSFVPILDVIFEHRLYLPMAGVCMSFPFFMEFAYRQLRRRFNVAGTAYAYSCLVLVALGFGTVMRNHIWGDEVRLWTDVLSKSPGKPRAYNALAFAHYKRNEYDQGIAVLEKGREALPGKLLDFSDTLANFYLQARRYDDAIEFFNQTIGGFTGERLALAYNNLGVAWLYKWDHLQVRRAQYTPEQFAIERETVLKPAAEAFSKSLELNPEQPWALDSYVNVSVYRGKGAEVEVAAIERIKDDREDFGSLYTVGKVAFNNGDWARADEYFERAEKLRNDVNVKLMFFNHGYTLVQLRQDDRAIEKYTQAIRLDPIFIQAHHNLGLIYIGRARYAEAAEAFAEVLRMDPNHRTSNLNLAKIYIAQRNTALARKHLGTILRASPGDQEAAALLQQLGGQSK